jgi:lysophospholipase L1-like esterase
MKEKLTNATLFIGTIVLSLLALEVGLRAYHGEWEYTNFRFPQQNKFGYHTYDPELGWVPKSSNQWGMSLTILKEGIRSNGRGESWDGTDNPILAVGDSYTFGDKVSDSETWPAQLEKLSGRRVINGGVDGYGVDQIFLRARRFLSRYRFSAVIFSFIPDDIRRSQMSMMFATAKPYFDVKDGQLTLENVPVPPTFLPEQEGELLIALEHSRLAHTVMKRLFPEWWLRAPFERQAQDRENGIKVACGVLHELEGLTKLRGSELIVLAQRTEVETPSEATATKGVLSCVTDPATRVLDLQPALSELKAKDPSRYHRLYIPNDGHMTAEGNQFVAREILPVLGER